MARVLVAEDEEAFGALLRAWLERDGHEVRMAGGGDAGVDQIFSEGRFDLVVTDLLMPRGDGEDLAVACSHFTPDTPVLVVTGCSDDEWLDRLERNPNIIRVLRKPVTRESFIDAVTAVLAVWDKT